MLLDVADDQFRLYASYREKDVAKLAGARWDGRRRCWVFPDLPPDGLLAASGLSVTKSAAERLAQECARREALEALHRASDVELGCGHGAGLDPYQRVGAKFLALAKRAILADFVGAGKSAQAIRAACEVGARKALVVTRKSLIHNWHQQFELWMPVRASFTYDITNYEQVVRRLDEFVRQGYDVLIADEATQVKNRKAQRSRALFALAKGIPHVWLLTGTPVLNRPDELWMLLHIVNPARYGSYWKFVEQYCLLERNPWSGGWKVVGLKPGASGALAKELAPVLLRRERNTVALPPITRETIYVELTPTQKELYRSMLKEFYVLLDQGTMLHAPSVVAQLVRLKQIACTPVLVGGPDESAKTQALLEYAEDYARDYKLLVFTTFAKYADHLADKLAEYGVVKITGAVSEKSRKEAADAFNGDPACRVLVGTIGAMSEGLNLQSADIIVFTDKAWVPSAVEQAEGRAWRRGRVHPVHVVTLVASKTVDEHIEAVLQSKVRIVKEMDAVMRLAALIKARREEC